jgi:tetratricopeptide (TPR) repeat protein
MDFLGAQGEVLSSFNEAFNSDLTPSSPFESSDNLDSTQSPFVDLIFGFLSKDSLKGEGRLGAVVASRIRDIDAMLEKGRATEALVLIEETLVDRSLLSPKALADMLGFKSEAQILLNKLEEAFEGLSESVKIDPTRARSFRALGFLSFRNHSNDEALAFFRKSLGLQPNDSQAIMGIGLVYRRVKMFAETIFWLEKAAVSGVHQALIHISQACLEHDNFSESAKVLERLIDHFGDEQCLIRSLGKIYMHAGRQELGDKLMARLEQVS